MNPEGKLHDWTDLPEEEIPELQQIATGGHNPEAQRQMVENLQACKGKGKMRVEFEPNEPSNMTVCPVQPPIHGYATGNKQSSVGSFGGVSNGWQAQNGKTFQSSYAEVFKNRRGIFEQGRLFESQPHKTLDDLTLAMPRVTSFSKPLKSLSKPKGNRVQFEEIEANDQNCHIANHSSKRALNSSMIDSYAVSANNLKLTNNQTHNKETINNSDTNHVPIWNPLSRSRTDPNLASSPGNVSSTRNKFGEHILHNTKEQKKVTISYCSFT